MSNEDKISKSICDTIQKRIERDKDFHFPINIGHKKKIFIGSTCGVSKNKPKLLFQSAEQDIVIYLKDENNEYNFEGTNFFQKFRRSLTDGKILIPLLIFEAKNEGVITHGVRQYSEIARMIKYIFPFCMYNFLLINIPLTQVDSSDKIYMSSKYFDRVIYKTGYEINNDIHNETVSEMLNLISYHLNYLKEEKFFRFTNVL
jgi:hypothetical protein